MSGEGENTVDYRDPAGQTDDVSFNGMNYPDGLDTSQWCRIVPEQIPPKVEVAKCLLSGGVFTGEYVGPKERRLYDKLIKTVMEYYDIPEEGE